MSKLALVPNISLDDVVAQFAESAKEAAARHEENPGNSINVIHPFGNGVTGCMITTEEGISRSVVVNGEIVYKHVTNNETETLFCPNSAVRFYEILTHYVNK